MSRKYVSLFSGAMGLDLGLESQGFEPAVICELDGAAVATIRKNRPKLPIVATDIAAVGRRELEAEAGVSLKGVDLVVGGPPCQAFSVMGRRQGIEDERGSLTFDFVRIVDELRPRAFLMENVRGLLSMPLAPKGSGIPDTDPRRAHGGLFKLLLDDFNRLGYRVQVFVVNSANYGAPQVRERLLIIGNRFDRDVDFPAPQFSNLPEDHLPPFSTLRDVIGPGFEDPDPTLMNFSARKLHYLSMVPPGGNWRSLPEELQQEAMGKQYFLKGGRSSSWRRLSWDFPSPTVHTLPNHATTSMCHPGELRALTVGECAAIQEFPANWEMCGTPSEKYRQIGNAVPVRLGSVAGSVLKQLLDELDSSEARPRKPSKEAMVQHLRPHIRVRTWYHRDHGAFSGSTEYGAHKTRPSQQPTLFDDIEDDYDEAASA